MSDKALGVCGVLLMLTVLALAAGLLIVGDGVWLVLRAFKGVGDALLDFVGEHCEDFE